MRRRERKKRLNKNKSLFLIVSITIVVVLISFLLTIWLNVINLEKFTLVLKTENGGAEILIVDPKKDSVKKYKIDPELVLNSANGYGEYKINSLWTLGEKEGFDGQLLSTSIASNFLIPVYLWKNENKSNLNLYQKIKLKFISNSSIEDGGFLEDFNLPNSILINFINEKIQESKIGVEIEDLTGDTDSINKVSKIIGTLGTKVSEYTKSYDLEADCEVHAKDAEIRDLLSSIFICQGISSEDGSKIRIKLGAKFAQRF